MPRVSSSVESNLATLFRVGTIGDLSDRPLLDHFLAGGDAAGPAFERIVARYGPMVMSVCRRVAGDTHVAEDAFQAAFLVLALRAKAIRRREALGPWLHGVAARVARRARDATPRRGGPEAPGLGQETMASGNVGAEADLADLRRVLDEELGRLPAKYRDPLVLCYLNGRSQEETACILGWTKGTVSGRLARAKELLRDRLARRGIVPSAAMFATSLALPAACPANLVRVAVRDGLATSVGVADAASASAHVLELARGAIRGMSAVRRAMIPACLSLTALGTAGAWALAAGGIILPRPVPADPFPVPSPAPSARQVADAPLPAGATLRFGTPRFRHTTTIENLAVSSDAMVAVAASGTRAFNTVRAYDLTNGRIRLPLLAEMSDVSAVALSPGGTTLAAIGAVHPAVSFYEMTSGKQTARISYPTANPGMVSNVLLFAPDGKHVVVTSADGKALYLIGQAEGGVVRTYPTSGVVFAAALSPNGKHLAAGGYDYEKGDSFARRWEVDTGRELGPLATRKGTVRCVAYSPDGSALAIGVEARDSRVELIDAATGERRLEIPFPDARSLAFSPNGRMVAASGGSTTRLFDDKGEERVRIDQRATGLRFSPDGSTLIGAVGGTIFLWDAATGRSLIPEGGESPVDQIAVTADGKRVVTHGQDGDAHIWDAATGLHQRRVSMGWQRGFALSPDGRFLVWPAVEEGISFPSVEWPGATRTGSRLRMMDIATGTLIERFGGYKGDAHDLFFTSDGRTLVTAERYARGAMVRIWDVATGKVSREFAAEWEPRGRVWRSRLAPDGKMLAVMYQGQDIGLSVESRVKLWDIATGEEIAGPIPHWFDPEVIAFAPDEKTVAVVSSSGTTIRLQVMATGQVSGEFRGLRDRVTALAFGPDGQLFSGSPDGTVLSWDPHAAERPTLGRE